MNHFPLGRLGNKQQDIKHFIQYLPDAKTLNTVCEPFAGSFAVIRNNYKDVKNVICAENDEKYLNTLKAILSNLDEFKETKEKINAITKQHNKISKDCKHLIIDVLKDNKFLSIDDLFMRGNFKKLTTQYDYSEIAKLFNRIVWFNDFKEAINKCIDNKKAFIFIDPPYFSSDNKTYHQNNKVNITDNTIMFIEILEYFKKAKCKVMMIINENAITKYIYKDYYKESYLKQYSLSNKYEQLMILTNY